MDEDSDLWRGDVLTRVCVIVKRITPKVMGGIFQNLRNMSVIVQHYYHHYYYYGIVLVCMPLYLLAGRSLKCPQHTDEQRRAVRQHLLGENSLSAV